MRWAQRDGLCETAGGVFLVSRVYWQHLAALLGKQRLHRPSHTLRSELQPFRGSVLEHRRRFRTFLTPTEMIRTSKQTSDQQESKQTCVRGSRQAADIRDTECVFSVCLDQCVAGFSPESSRIKMV